MQNRSWMRKVLTWLGPLVLVLSIQLSYADNIIDDDNDAQFVEYLASEKTNLTLAIQQSTITTMPSSQNELERLVHENEVLLTLISAKISSLEGFLHSQKKELQLEQDNFDKLQQALPNRPGELTHLDKMGKLQTIINVTKKTIDLINEDLTLAKNYQDILLSKQKEIALWSKKFKENDALNLLDEQKNTLKNQLTQLYQENIEYQETHTAQGLKSSSLQYEANVLLNNQKINLIQQKIYKIELEKSIIRADYALFKYQDIKTYQMVSDTYHKVIQQFTFIRHRFEKILSILQQEQLQLDNSEFSLNIQALKKQLNIESQEIQNYQKKLESAQDQIQQQLITLLATRQGLSEYQLVSWPKIFEQLMRIPAQFYTYLKILVLKVRDNYVWQDVWPNLVFWILLVAITAGFYFIHHWLKPFLKERSRHRITLHLYDGLLLLIDQNIVQLASFSLVLAILYLNNIPYVNYRMLIHLCGVWFIFRGLHLIARRVLLERMSDVSGKDVKLYHRVLWMLSTGGISTALMIFGQEYPLTLLLQDIFNRLFMFFLLTLSIVIWRSRETITYLLSPIFLSKVRYIRNAFQILLILVPLTVSFTALVGLMGYSNLASTMGQYQIYFVLTLVGYTLSRGLMIDLLDLFSEWMIQSLTNGWLWTEVFLKPIDRILRIGLFTLFIFLTLWFLGWFSDAEIIKGLWTLGQIDLIHVSGIHINILSTIEFAVLASFLLWAAKWSRELSYRWIYNKTKDEGIRNSLSVFTQYSIVLLGGFVALQVLGFDLSGMSMIFGGLAVGLGFGLRDFANNIVGGLMLLIERPVREGDLITLGSFEGKVAHIGIRSMRVSTGDNMEVLIPNAETFNKPFTNWTHQDNIVRTVFPLKVSRMDCPLKVQKLVMDVLEGIPEVLRSPAPQVFLKHIDEALLEFEVRFFINIVAHSRMEIRSKILFAISETFQEAGIKAPIPPIRVELRDKLEDDEFSGITPCKE